MHRQAIKLSEVVVNVFCVRIEAENVSQRNLFESR